jgi:prephenate dehydrogenase
MRVAVVGVGLIGGSIGMAVRQRLGAVVTGFDPDPAVLEAALARAAIDAVAASPAAAVADADLVFVGAPVGELEDVIAEVLRHASADCAVTDVGSTKRSIVAAASDRRFIGGHPLAGAETSGVEHARADLFDGATWYLTPHAQTTGVLYERLHRAIAGIGAQPTAIDAEIHDRVMATVSHLPHVLANVLVAQAARALADPHSPGKAERVPATGPSFRDATRVAGANAAIWPDIYLSNRDALVRAVDDTIDRLAAVRASLAAADRAGIVAWNDAARADRDALLGAGLAGGAVHELRVAVPNRPGVIAEIALTLGRAGVNIVDMALSPSPAEDQGVVALWLQGEDQTERAVELIDALSMPVVRA